MEKNPRSGERISKADIMEVNRNGFVVNLYDLAMI
jgi:hypothetical protein